MTPVSEVPGPMALLVLAVIALAATALGGLVVSLARWGHQPPEDSGA
jgi:hypothetical protein